MLSLAEDRMVKGKTQTQTGPTVVEVPVSTATGEALTPTESWLDLIPPNDPDGMIERWISREALIADLADNGFHVTARSLRRWEANSVIPKPLVQWRGGRPNTLYPPFAPVVVLWLLQLKEAGRSFDEIGPMLRSMITELLKGQRSRPRELWNETLSALLQQTHHLTAAYRAMTGHSITALTIQMTDAAGHDMKITHQLTGTSSGTGSARGELDTK
jgi:hypothetical protein